MIQERTLDIQPFEVKSAITYSPALYKNLLKFMTLEPSATIPTLIYGGEDAGVLQGVKVTSFRQFAKLLDE